MGGARRTVNRIAVAVLALAYLACLGVTASSSAATDPSTLAAGQSLYAYGAGFPDGARNGLLSSSGQYLLGVQNGQLTIQEYLPGYGCAPWFTPQTGSATDTTRLSMQTDGNLVLRTSAGRAIWASHTIGSGTNNRLVMQNNGNLVIYSATGAVVWQSHSGAGCLIPGMSIASGGRLVSRYQANNTSPITSLMMQRGGNLVLFYGSRAVWQTKTAVWGSTARLLSNGNFAVYSPTHKLLWNSRSWYLGSRARLLIDPCGSFSIYAANVSRTWQTPAVPHPGCL